MIALAEHARGTVLPVKAQPGARKNGILGVRAEALRVAVTAAPERGKANEAIALVLAEALNLKGSQVRLLSGETSREKRFLIEDVGPDEIRIRLDVLMGSGPPSRLREP